MADVGPLSNEEAEKLCSPQDPATKVRRSHTNPQL